MKKKPHLIPLLNFFAETLRETLEESDLSQAEIARRCGIPAPHLTQMKKGNVSRPIDLSSYLKG